MKLKWLLTNERGHLLLEALVAIIAISAVFLIMVTNHKNVSTAKYALNTSEDFNTRSLTAMYRKIAPEIAVGLSIEDEVIIRIDSPNYLPTSEGIKYLNIYEDYGKERISGEPLIVGNNLKSKSNLVVTRTGINSYLCDVNIEVDDYRVIEMEEIDLIPGKAISMGRDITKAKIASGNIENYKYSFSGVIVDE